MALRIKFWGTRGSLPSAPLPSENYYHLESVLRGFFAAGYREAMQIPKFLGEEELPVIGGYGSATQCIEVDSPRAQIIIDGGSGIKDLASKIMSGGGGRVKGPFHIFMTHFHWDHIIGLPFFPAHFTPGVHIHYYAVQTDLEKHIRQVFERPYFPVEFEKLSAKIHFHIIEPRKPLQIDDMTITPYRLDHPDECWGFKIKSGNNVYAHCVDTEATRVSREELGEDLPLYQGVDLMYFDAQYTLPELSEKANWGHSAAQVGLDIAMREGIQQVYFGHHDPNASIQHIKELKRQTQDYYNWRKSHPSEMGPVEVKWDFAYDGLEVTLNK